MSEPLTSGSISTKLERIAKLANKAPEMAFRSLAHHIDMDWLREAYRRTRKNGAAGVDGQNAREYAADLESNLQSLLDRVKSGTYRSGTSSSQGTHPQGIGLRNEADWDTNLRG